MRSILESAVTSQPDTNTILYAAIVDTDGNAVAHSTPSLEGQPTPQLEDLKNIVDASGDRSAAGSCSRSAATSCASRFWPATPPSARFASACRRCSCAPKSSRRSTSFGYTAVIALAISTMVATLLAQWMLRPIHVIQSGLTRLGRGELDVRLDLPGQEFADLGQLVRSGQRPARRRAQQRAAGGGLAPRPNSSRSWRTSRTRSRSSRPKAS